MVNSKKEEMLKEIETKITNWNTYSEFAYGYTKKDAEIFLTRFRIGIYDAILKETFWFGEKLNLDDLICWDADRRHNNKYLNNITEENYKVFVAFLSIKEHAIRVNNYPTAFKTNYKTKKENYEQTPMTQEEKDSFNNLYQLLLSKNYNWREARAIIKSIKDLDIYENADFPHNIDQITDALKTKPVSYFQDFFGHGKCCFEIERIRKIATNLISKLTKENFTTLFEKSSKTKEEEYLRRIILSTLDIPLLVYQYDNYCLEENLKNIATELEKNTTLSKSSLEILFKKIDKDELLASVTAILKSLIYPIKKLNISDTYQDFEKQLDSTIKSQKNEDNINSTNIYSKNSKTEILNSTNLQKFYEFLYIKTNELEYTEGCIEILGELLNKTSKEKKLIPLCVFNTLLMSHGILPPIVDLNQNEFALLKAFICSKNDHYGLAIPKVLKDMITLTNDFKNGKFTYPLEIGKNAFKRPMFQEEII